MIKLAKIFVLEFPKNVQGHKLLIKNIQMFMKFIVINKFKIRKNNLKNKFIFLAIKCEPYLKKNNSFTKRALIFALKKYNIELI